MDKLMFLQSNPRNFYAPRDYQLEAYTQLQASSEDQLDYNKNGYVFTLIKTSTNDICSLKREDGELSGYIGPENELHWLNRVFSSE